MEQEQVLAVRCRPIINLGISGWWDICRTVRQQQERCCPLHVNASARGHPSVLSMKLPSSHRTDRENQALKDNKENRNAGEVICVAFAARKWTKRSLQPL
ncbi:hypothetical protein QOT17_011195 [Balamuthia mandrillaris]